MSQYRKIRWYRIDVAKRIGILDGEVLITEIEDIIEDIRKKKLDKNGMFKLLIQQLEGMIAETRFKPKQKGRVFDPFHIPRSGDGRIVLFGLSNVGKSTLINAITNTDVKTGNYLNTTRTALAGTCIYKNVKIQIIDVPGFLDFKKDWVVSKQIVRVARTCDSILLVIDLSFDIERQYQFLMTELENAGLISNADSLCNLGIIATKGDLPGSRENFEKLKDLTSLSIHPITIQNQDSLEKLQEYLFNVMQVLRIYTKPPRGEINRKTPFICLKGTLVSDIAKKIHKDLLKNFRYAKIWGSSTDFQGQRVGLEHELRDEDIIEITIHRKS
jgi:small GTP-binding protein